MLNPIEPYTTYRISCDERGTSVGICWIGGGPGWTLRKRFPEGTYSDWRRVETEFTTDGSGAEFDLMVCSESQTVALYVDDVEVVAIRADAAKRDAAMARGKDQLTRALQHLDRVQAEIIRHRAQDDPIARLGIAIAKRYLQRVQSPKVRQSRAWSDLQVQEVDEVLSQTQAELANVEYRRSRRRNSSSRLAEPYFRYGMGHFSQIFNELAFWPEVGVTLLQDGRCGPSSMNPDGSLAQGAKTLLADMHRANAHNLKVDFLLSPHYFPDWALNGPAHNELIQGGLGFLGYDIDHPVARDVVGKWARQMAHALHNEPGLFSVCLSNEPVYDDSGRTAETLQLYEQFLEQRHSSIAALNQLYGTQYDDFSHVKPPPPIYGKSDEQNRAFFDWHEFNDQHFADWHAWMRSLVRRDLPHTPTHAKIMVFQSMDRDKMHFGVDPELFCRATDIAGCDAYEFPAGDYKTFDWHGHAFWYDLLHSFRGQPVFDSENHIIPDGTGPLHIPLNMTRAQFWEDALHHERATTTWVWEEAGDSSLVGSIFFRPANAYGACKAFLEINEFAPELAAINNASANCGLLYSPASVFWSSTYAPTIHSIYNQLNFLGQPITFVSERQLAEKNTGGVRVIILPQATHVTSTTIVALQQFAARGGHVLRIGSSNLEHDEYNRSRQLPALLADAQLLQEATNETSSAILLRNALGEFQIPFTDLLLASGERAWGVEYRSVKYGVSTVMPLLNHNPSTVEVRLPRAATDLLTGNPVRGTLRLEPMVPRLLLFTEGS